MSEPKWELVEGNPWPIKKLIAVIGLEGDIYGGKASSDNRFERGRESLAIAHLPTGTRFPL